MRLWFTAKQGCGRNRLCCEISHFSTPLDVLMIHWNALLSSQDEEPCLAATKPRRAAPCIVFVFFIYLFFLCFRHSRLMLSSSFFMTKMQHQHPNAATLSSKAPF